MNKRLGLVGFGLSILAISSTIGLAQAPLIPFHAKIQRIQQTFGTNGSLEVEESITDDYALNSQGSAYTESEIIDSITGQMTGSLKILESARDGRTYLIDEVKKTVVIAPHQSQTKQFQPDPSLQRKTCLDRTCAVYPPQEGSEVWVDVELGYPMYEHREILLAGGGKMVRVSRVTEITVNQEPDPKLFIVPSFSGYSVTDLTR